MNALELLFRISNAINNYKPLKQWVRYHEIRFGLTSFQIRDFKDLFHATCKPYDETCTCKSVYVLLNQSSNRANPCIHNHLNKIKCDSIFKYFFKNQSYLDHVY